MSRFLSVLFVATMFVNDAQASDPSHGNCPACDAWEEWVDDLIRDIIDGVETGPRPGVEWTPPSSSGPTISQLNCQPCSYWDEKILAFCDLNGQQVHPDYTCELDPDGCGMTTNWMCKDSDDSDPEEPEEPQPTDEDPLGGN